MIDYLIVGAGLFGSVCAYELTHTYKKSVLVIEKRNHIGGNVYTEERDGIHIHMYGPHIFHTSNEKIWNWINQFVKFNDFTLRPVANFEGEIYSLPFNMWTFSKIWNITTPYEARQIIEEQSKEIVGEPINLEEQAIKMVGRDIYEKLIYGYTKKNWRKDPKELPPEIIKRLPVRYTYDNNYFNDIYQGIPIGGYTQIFENMLDGIEVYLGVDYLEDKEKWNAKKVIYTGPIDKYFDNKFGELDYKYTKFDHCKILTPDFQGTAMVNHTSEKIQFHTRTIEHKHWENTKTDEFTWVTWETPLDPEEGDEPYYPIMDISNKNKYKKYEELADELPNVFFGGRLAEFKYYDMHQVIGSALNKVKNYVL